MITLTFVVGLAAAVFSGVGLAIMWNQLVAAREAGHGRGLYLRVERSRFVRVDRRTKKFGLGVSASGPGTWANLTGHLVRESGESVEELWDEARFDATCESVFVEREMPSEEAKNMFLVVTWLRPRSRGLRSEAIRTRLLTGDGDRQIEEFRWYRTHRMRAWYQHSRRKCLPGSGKHRPLGRWKAIRIHDYDENQLPGFPF